LAGQASDTSSVKSYRREEKQFNSAKRSTGARSPGALRVRLYRCETPEEQVVANRDYIPAFDEGKRVWANNLAALLTAGAVSYGITVPAAAAYQAVADAYDAALTAAVAPSTRGPSTITTKNTARTALVAASREIVATLQGNAALTPTQKQDLGITDRGANGPTPISAPTDVPVAKIISVNGWVTEVQITVAESSSRALPEAVAGINIYSFTGATPPTDPLLWTYEGEVSRSRFKISAPPETPVGTKIFYAFCFKSPRFQVGPACAGVPVVIGGGVPETNVG
jgi:hypothetical protein